MTSPSSKTPPEDFPVFSGALQDFIFSILWYCSANDFYDILMSSRHKEGQESQQSLWEEFIENEQRVDQFFRSLNLLHKQLKMVGDLLSTEDSAILNRYLKAFTETIPDLPLFLEPKRLIQSVQHKLYGQAIEQHNLFSFQILLNHFQEPKALHQWVEGRQNYLLLLAIGQNSQDIAQILLASCPLLSDAESLLTRIDAMDPLHPFVHVGINDPILDCFWWKKVLLNPSLLDMLTGRSLKDKYAAEEREQEQAMQYAKEHNTLIGPSLDLVQAILTGMRHRCMESEKEMIAVGGDLTTELRDFPLSRGLVLSTFYLRDSLQPEEVTQMDETVFSPNSAEKEAILTLRIRKNLPWIQEMSNWGDHPVKSTVGEALIEQLAELSFKETKNTQRFLQEKPFLVSGSTRMVGGTAASHWSAHFFKHRNEEANSIMTMSQPPASLIEQEIQRTAEHLIFFAKFWAKITPEAPLDPEEIIQSFQGHCAILNPRGVFSPPLEKTYLSVCSELSQRLSGKSPPKPRKTKRM